MKIKACLLILSSFITLLSFAQKPELIIPRGHAENITQLSISPDGKLLASGSWDKSFRIWDVASGRELKAVENFPHWVNSVAFSPDGKRLVAGSYKELRVYDISNGGKEIARKTTHTDDIISIAFSPDSKIMATAGSSYHDIDVKLWNTAGTITLLKSIADKGDVRALRFTSNNELLIIAVGKIIHVNVATGAITNTETFGESTAHYLSPDGKWFVQEGFEMGDGSTDDLLNSLSLDISTEDENPKGKHAMLTIINRATKEVMHVFKGQTASIKDVAFSPDSRYVLSAADNTVYIYDLQTMSRVARLTDKMSYPYGFAFTADGKTLFLGNYDQIIRQYDFTNYKLVKQLGGAANAIYNIALSPDAKSLSIVGWQSYFHNGFMQTLDLTKGSLSKSYTASGFNGTVRYTPNSHYLVSGNFGGLKVIDAATGDTETVSNAEPGTTLAIGADGKQIATSNWDKSSPDLLIRSLPDGNTMATFSLPYNAGQLLYSHDGKSIYAGLTSGNKTVKVDAATGAVKQTFIHPGQYADVTGIKQLLLSDDESTLITGDEFGMLRFWNTATGKETDTLKVGSNQTNSMIFLPGNKQIALCSGESGFADTTIKIIDVASKKIAYTLSGHKGSPSSLAVTPDGKFLFSGSYDRSILVWNLATKEKLATIVLFGENDWAMVDKDGRFDGTQNGMHQMYYTRGFDILPLESAFEQFYTPGLLPRLLNGESFAPPIVDINNIKPAPKVKIVYNPRLRNLVLANDIATFDTDDSQLSFSVQASAPDDVVDEIRLYQNGKLITTTNRNLVVDNDNSSEQTKAFTLTLTEGANEIKAVAINSQRTESVPDEIILNYKPQANNITNSTTTLHLMVVAVNTYKNPKYNLNYALADATAFKDEMEKNSSNIYGSVKLHFITDADAMKANIESNFKEIEQQAKPQDVFIFYYAGHGVMSDEAKKDFYIVPYDVLQLYGADDALAQKGISAAELQEFSKNIAAQKQLFILDACQSAGALEAVASRGVAEEKAIAQLARSTGTHWLTASGSEQYAEEFAQLGHGAFTYTLLQGLEGAADNGDHQITVNELKAYLETAVPELTQKYKGAAQYPASYGFGNDFPVEVVK